MGFRTGAIAKCWQIEHKSQGWAKVRLSTSRKILETNEYETDFSGFVDFVGTACVQKLSRYKDGDRVVLNDVEVINRYDKEKDVTYTNFKCYSFIDVDEFFAEQARKKEEKAVDSGEIDPPDEDSAGDYPF